MPSQTSSKTSKSNSQSDGSTVVALQTSNHESWVQSSSRSLSICVYRKSFYSTDKVMLQFQKCRIKAFSSIPIFSFYLRNQYRVPFLASCIQNGPHEVLRCLLWSKDKQHTRLIVKIATTQYPLTSSDKRYCHFLNGPLDIFFDVKAW